MPKRGLKKAPRRAVVRALLSNPKVLRVKPSLGIFLLRYMNKFEIDDVGGNLILHSHLPPLNSPAYRRFVDEHLLARVDGPSHAQVGLTNACPQKCAYCYNRDRSGKPMDTPTILKAVRDLREAGVFWIGLTGGEPLLNRDIVKITEAAADGCAVKLFTTGCGISPERARALREAGLFSVSVSLDHWDEGVHDGGRGYPGAFREALRAVEIFLATPGLHVGVSAVLSKETIRRGDAEKFLEFLIGLGVHEAWLSEIKPSSAPFWRDDVCASEENRDYLSRLQDRVNKEGRITVNYLGHFEGRKHFGCNAGRKMVYVDAFGDVSPCVFTPMTFGNVRERPLREIVREMAGHFRSSRACFILRNFRLFEKHGTEGLPLDRERSLKLISECTFRAPGEFFRRYEKAGPKRKDVRT